MERRSGAMFMKNKYEICGYIVKIFLHRKDGTTMETIIDKEDFEKANSAKGTWYAGYDKPTNTYYCKCDEYLGKRLRLHRVIMGVGRPDVLVDHKSHDTLDNRKNNLRSGTKSHNAQNMIKPRSDNKTGYLGVCYSKRRNKYRATITTDGKHKHIGYFNTPIQAYKAYVETKQKLHKFNTLQEVV